MKHLHLIIHGNVQGVGFRWSTMREAQKLRLVGWVKNKSDGTVEVVAEGEEGALNKLKEWCEKGAFMTYVERISSKLEDVEKIEFEGFDIKR